MNFKLSTLILSGALVLSSQLHAASIITFATAGILKVTAFATVALSGNQLIALNESQDTALAYAQSEQESEVPVVLANAFEIVEEAIVDENAKNDFVRSSNRDKAIVVVSLVEELNRNQ